MPVKANLPWGQLAALLAANLALLLSDANPLRVGGALLLLGLLPGLGWTNRLLPAATPLLRLSAAAALSYAITLLSTLLLHYLPGPVPAWSLLAILNIFALIPYLPQFRPPDPRAFAPSPFTLAPAHLRPYLPLIFILVIALYLRAANLSYSEFQGDEALAMISAAEALSGHEDALFLRSKGPGEVLLPMALWRLTGTISEAIARLPFTLAALWAVIAIYLVGERLGSPRVGWLAAGFFAFNGFMVAFGRIVQYQALVVWFSAMAVVMALHWQRTRQHRAAALGGLWLGCGLLAHYDAILALPAAGWLLLAGLAGPPAENKPLAPSRPRTFAFVAPAVFITTMLLAAVPFYLPYGLDPQANRTGDYVGQRIGSALRNNLPDFFHFTTFYSSAYYLLVTGLLVAGLLGWLVWRRWPRAGWAAALLLAGIGAIIFQPSLLASPDGDLNLAVIPFALLLLAAFLAAPFASPRQALVIWLAAPFLGYIFVVALGLTHIYTTVPAWSLLAALGWERLTSRRPQFIIAVAPLVVLFGLSTIFLWNAFVRHDVEYWQDYPAGNLPLFWNPYEQPPAAGFFGFAHRAGWKAVGQQLASGKLAGDYGSNEEPDVTAWYTRGAPRACDPQPEFYFLADDLIDPVEVPAGLIDTHYAQVGAVDLSNQKQLRLMQRQPATLTLGNLDDDILAAAFDQTATPTAFARSARGAAPAQANFGNLVKLVGFDLDTRRAHPGGRVPVTLYWQTLAPIPASYQVFTHLASEAGPVAQADGVPVCWSYPTDLWRPGQIIADQHAIALSPEIPAGAYPLEIGLYLPDNFQRLDVLDEAGNPAGTSVTLAMIEIGE